MNATRHAGADPGAALRRGGARLSVWCVVGLAACAQVPSAPAPETLPSGTQARPARSDDPVVQAIVQHRQLAQKARDAGELADAAAQWQILTLLAPDDESFRRELNATRAAIRQGVAAELATGATALRNGETDRASQAFLRALALDPQNPEAARALRDIDRQKLARIQQDRAAKLKPIDMAAVARSPRNQALPPAEVAETFDIEQRIELLQAGDVAGGLRELHAFVVANPNDRAARQRIGAAVYERGRDLERKGTREQALTMYEEAVALRGDAPAEWSARITALRRALSDEYYEIGVRAYRTDLALAIKQWESSLRFDPKNLKAASRLQEARLAQAKLQRIEAEAARK
jgi:tetratricopeptide (TPR) repeat protein